MGDDPGHGDSNASGCIVLGCISVVSGVEGKKDRGDEAGFGDNDDGGRSV
jgi:hypothetical protein